MQAWADRATCAACKVQRAHSRARALRCARARAPLPDTAQAACAAARACAVTEHTV
jgi:hypothetical protein